MKRRSFLQGLLALAPGVWLIHKLGPVKLAPGFKYWGNGVYSYPHAYWKDSSGKGYTMWSAHSRPLSLKEVDSPEIARKYRIEAAVKLVSKLPEKDRIIVMHESRVCEGGDKSGMNYQGALDPDGMWYNRVYDSTRFFTIDRKTLEKEIWL